MVPIHAIAQSWACHQGSYWLFFLDGLIALYLSRLRLERTCLQRGRPALDPWVGKVPWRRPWHPTPVSLPRESHGQRSLAGYSPRGHKGRDMPEGLTLSLFQKEASSLKRVSYLAGQRSQVNRSQTPACQLYCESNFNLLPGFAPSTLPPLPSLFQLLRVDSSWWESPGLRWLWKANP